MLSLPCTLKRLFFAVSCILLVGCATSHHTQKPTKTVCFYVEASEIQSDIIRPGVARMPLSGYSFLFYPEPVLSAYLLSDISVIEAELGPCLCFQFNLEGTQALQNLTTAHQGQRLLLFVEDEPLGFVYITEPVRDGRLFIFIEAEDKQVQPYVNKIKSFIK
jgi:hypothetical protein